MFALQSDDTHKTTHACIPRWIICRPHVINIIRLARNHSSSPDADTTSSGAAASTRWCRHSCQQLSSRWWGHHWHHHHYWTIIALCCKCMVYGIYHGSECACCRIPTLWRNRKYANLGLFRYKIQNLKTILRHMHGVLNLKK